MANAVVTKTGDITEIIYNDVAVDIERMAINEVTTKSVILNIGDTPVQTDIFGEEKVFVFTDFATIGGNTVASDIDLYNELKALL